MPSAPATSLFLGSAAPASPIALDAVFVAVQLGARTSPCTS
ncbi:MAG TPA: hypothetical protein VFA88_10300 [Gaiellaceae bacterium]|nr:hypothetical protein [Gaiellaceae bacterium]